MTLNELMTVANYIARTEGSTQPDGRFGPSTWKSCNERSEVHVESMSMPVDDNNIAIAADQLSVC